MGRRPKKESRSCRACGASRPAGYSPDPCLGTLPGVRNACCGHGNTLACVLQLYAEYAAVVFPELIANPGVRTFPGDGGRGRGVRTYVNVVVLTGEAAREIMLRMGGRPAPLAVLPSVDDLDGWVERKES